MRQTRLDHASIVTALVVLSTFVKAQDEPANTSKKPVLCVPTFHCLSLYWSPEGGELEKKVLVKFRESTEKTWHNGLPMRYNPVKTKECKGDYRGSIVNLKPNTAYDISLTLEGTSINTSLKGTTWNEKFPVGST